MGDTSAIAWTDSTFNPWIGCTRVGPGCDGCYAAAFDARHKWGGATHWGAGVPRYRTKPANWNKPRKWNELAAASGKRHLVFCASLADVFDNEVPDAWRADLFALIRETPALTWQLVTKRIGNAPRMLPADWGTGYQNVWLISTIVNQEEADRDIPKLLDVRARVHGVSYEPAIGAVDWTPWLHDSTCMGVHDSTGECTCSEPREDRVDWIIIGGESGPGARPCDGAWIRSAVEQCTGAGVPVFVKQFGARPILDCPPGEEGEPQMRADGSARYWKIAMKDRKGADPAEWPPDLRVREFPL